MQLNPAQRGLLQLAENIFIAAVLAGLTAIAPYLSGTGSLDWGRILSVFGIAAIFALLNALSTTIKARNEPLGTVVEADVSALQARVTASQDATKHVGG